MAELASLFVLLDNVAGTICIIVSGVLFKRDEMLQSIWFLIISGMFFNG